MKFVSKLIEAYPLEKVDISQFQKRFVVDEKAIQTAMNRLVNKHISWSEGEAAKAGDVVTCSMESSLEKFNRQNMQLTLGIGLFDKEVEAALVGVKAGDRVSLLKGGEKVEIQVLSVRNKHVPQLTDEMVQELALPEVDTVEGYRQHLVEAQKEEQYNDDSYEAYRYVIKTVLERSDIIIREADWQQEID